MVGIIAVSHGTYAEALINSVQMIYGKHDKITTVCLEGKDSIESLNKKIDIKIKELDVDEILILVDLLGGTPYNASCLWMENPKINVVTGINMPMLLEILPYTNESLEKVSKIAEEFGKSGIINVRERYKTLNKTKDNNG